MLTQIFYETGVSVLELYLLVCMKRLEGKELESYNFNAVFRGNRLLISSSAHCSTFVEFFVHEYFRPYEASCLLLNCQQLISLRSLHRGNCRLVSVCLLVSQTDMVVAEYQYLQETHKTSDHYSREVTLRVTTISFTITTRLNISYILLNVNYD